jgi:hypothetical protein
MATQGILREWEGSIRLASLYYVVLLFSSTVVEHSAHNRKIGGSNPAHRPGSTGSVKMPIIGTAIAVLAELIGTVFIQNQACFESVR